MRSPWVNVAFLILLLLQAVTGYFGFTNGRPAAAWILWLHGIGAYSLVVLLFWKGSVILDAWGRKKRWTRRRIGFLILLVLLGLTLASGLLWTFTGPLYLGGFSLVSLHIYLAIPLILLMAWHAWHMRFIWRVRHAAGRRLFLGMLGGAAAGAFGWWALNRAKGSELAPGRPPATDSPMLPGATRRFTGSYEVGSLGGVFPVVSWIADRPPEIEAADWRLQVGGAIRRPLVFTYDQLRALAVDEIRAALDCTGGWYTEQVWDGVSVERLLAEMELLETAASITFQSQTGYKRRFGLAEAATFLLALDVAGQPLSQGHGFPLRLVAVNRRGVEWVKWVTAIEVNTTGPLWQLPLPVQ
jgi:DMSO/TMAO reductase YedYZ molybdopterin-dependent catalytic subunit